MWRYTFDITLVAVVIALAAVAIAVAAVIIAFVSAFIDADEIMFGVWQVLYANSAIDSFLISVMH